MLCEQEVNKMEKRKKGTSLHVCLSPFRAHFLQEIQKATKQSFVLLQPWSAAG